MRNPNQINITRNFTVHFEETNLELNEKRHALAGAKTKMTSSKRSGQGSRISDFPKPAQRQNVINTPTALSADVHINSRVEENIDNGRLSETDSQDIPVILFPFGMIPTPFLIMSKNHFKLTFKIFKFR